jgi:hypothetical protein
MVIEPDVTGFDLTEYVRAKQLAAIGAAAALEQISRIQQLLTRLDPQVFCPSGDALMWEAGQAGPRNPSSWRPGVAGNGSKWQEKTGPDGSPFPRSC